MGARPRSAVRLRVREAGPRGERVLPLHGDPGAEPTVRDVIPRLAEFPAIHRELLGISVAGNVVVVELAIRGTPEGESALPSRTLAATGRAIDLPCCDVFHLEDGKITSFHCYDAASMLQQRLGVAGSRGSCDTQGARTNPVLGRDRGYNVDRLRTACGPTASRR